MAELRDFMKKESAKLSDFVSEVSNNPMWSRPSAQSFAAHASLMSDDPVNTYDRVMSEMEVQGTSPTHQLYIDSLNRRAEEQSLRALSKCLEVITLTMLRLQSRATPTFPLSVRMNSLETQL